VTLYRIAWRQIPVSMGLMGGMCRFSMHAWAPRPYRRRYLE
jgi:hypothetical protein